MEVIALCAIGVVVSAWMGGELWTYLRWRRNLSRMDRGEWLRTIRSLRD